MMYLRSYILGIIVLWVRHAMKSSKISKAEMEVDASLELVHVALL